MNIIEEREHKRKETAEKAFQAYRRLLAKDAAGHKLTAAEKDEFSKAIENCGRNDESAAADRDAIIEELKIAARADGHDAATIALNDAEAKFKAEAAAEADRVSAAGAKLAQLRQAAIDAAKRANDIAAAQHALKDHRAKFWRILGGENPDLAARRRHLFQTVTGPVPKDLGCQPVTLESIMAAPHNWTLAQLAEVEWTRHETQTPEHFAYLLETARQLISENKPAIYIVPSDYQRENGGDISLCRGPGTIEPADLSRFCPLLPGQTQDNQERIREQARRRHKKEGRIPEAMTVYSR